ncbi:hypothetical protein C8Q77DRAFT_1058887, partial [Trametes polyzona]
MAAEHAYALQLVHNLRNKVYELEKSNISLSATVRTLQNAYKVLATAQPALVEASSNSEPLTRSIEVNALGRQGNATRHITRTPAPTVTYDKSKHGKLRFFYREQFRPYMKGQPKSDLATIEVDGGSGAPSRVKNIPIYMESLDGTLMNLQRYSDLRAHLRALFQTLLDEGLAPTVWSKINDTALNYVLVQVSRSFPEVAECENSWKIRYLASQLYSDFGRERGEAAASGTGSKKRPRDGD